MRKQKIRKLELGKRKYGVALDNKKEQRDNSVSMKTTVSHCCIGSMCKFERESFVHNQCCLSCNGKFHKLCAIWSASDDTWICQKCYNSSNVLQSCSKDNIPALF